MLMAVVHTIAITVSFGSPSAGGSTWRHHMLIAVVVIVAAAAELVAVELKQ